MIELKNICKAYKTGSFVQRALDDVSISFRDNEFVAVLGPSGSGKTTLLNILGGLDHADSGDIVINGVSTQRYRSSDWDTYRNHHIGFIFQSYNLIPHQTVLSNVELALTLAGVGRSERRARAKEALDRVGLAEHIGKKPSQLSGGQMQRVAIARALVNDPDIVLADEPTGALDTETGLQVMNLLQEIASDRLVIMVTHNPDLAEEYATRIVRLEDGRIIGDSDPVELAAAAQAAPAAAAAAVAAPRPIAPPGVDARTWAPEGTAAEPEEPPRASDAASSANTAPLPPVGYDASEQTMPFEAVAAARGNSAASAPEPRFGREGRSKGKKKASMSFLTALSLSFNNLMTKKGRTIMTAFAGSIGIMGIAAILALSNGVNQYIANVEEETLSSYPLSITKTSFDMEAMMTSMVVDLEAPAADEIDTADPIPEYTMVSDMFAEIKNNDLTSFKHFLESGESGIEPYVNTITYSYGITPLIYKADTSDGVVQLNPSPLSRRSAGSMGMMSAFMSWNSFGRMVDMPELLDAQYEVIAGRWPESYNECILCLDENGRLSDYTLYCIGVLDTNEMEDMVDKMANSEAVEVPDTKIDFSYDDALDLTFKVLPNAAVYRHNTDYNTWTDMSDDRDYMTDALADAEELKVVGVVQQRPTTRSGALSEGIYYMGSLPMHLLDQANEYEIVKAQLANPEVDVFTGKTFAELQDEQKQGIDLGSMFSFDQNAFANAFQFNTSAFDMSGIDFSSMDLSGMDMSSLAQAVDPDTIGEAMANAPMPDLSSVLSEVPQESMDAINQVAANIIMGFMPWWYSQHPGESITPDTDFSADFQVYLQTPEVAAQIAQAQAIAGDDIGQAVQSAMAEYMASVYGPIIQSAMEQMIGQMAESMATQMEQVMTQFMSGMENAFSIDTNALAGAFQFNMDEDDLTALLSNYMRGADLTYDANLSTLGWADPDDPESINIYPKDFDSKEAVLEVIDQYNGDMEAQGNEDGTITYSDIMGALISSVTRIVDMISLVLIAFVSISLVVSSIMIGIITYISVLERKKEIGILRAMGASKRNIANVFNAETIIEGLIAGVFAIIVVEIASIPVNAIILSAYQVERVMSLPWYDGVILIAISVLLTLIAGLIPSSAAARRDPVEALRSE